jgi:hypothetical protein
MNCMVCRDQMSPYFSKTFNLYGLRDVEYWKCRGCGFVGSKNHTEMKARDWETLNQEYHATYQGHDHNEDDPRWLERLSIQARVINDLASFGLLPRDLPWVDWGCGDGQLPDLLKARFGLSLLKYDRYKQGEEYLSEDSLASSRFGFVIHTSVFEHVSDRDALDGIERLVAPSGVFGIHTLVAEEIPQDPSWFYLLPVHCSFFTNKSMQVLFEEWGYSSSVYHIAAQLWFWFKQKPDFVEGFIRAANAQAGRETFQYQFKRGFMDYWQLNANDILLRGPRTK